jgi:hypothetical protein
LAAARDWVRIDPGASDRALGIQSDNLRARTAVARGGIEPPTFRFSVEDCRNIAAVATAYVSQGVWPYEAYQRSATVIGVSGRINDE